MSNAKVKVQGTVSATIPGVSTTSSKTAELVVKADAQQVDMEVREQGKLLARFSGSTSQLHAVLAAARALEVEQ